MSTVRDISVLLVAGVLLAGLSTFWLNQLNARIPVPYLDEIFHVPQAQAYCEVQLDAWDPKITTPPGLYAISALLIKFTFGGSCCIENLRSINLLGLLLLFHAAYDCRCNIKAEKSVLKSVVNKDAVHTAVNICLFPPIFFFSGLYYTDVLSTCIVIRAYGSFLSPEKSAFNPVMTILYGILALLMRQTNIFWVAVFLGGLEVMQVSQGTSNNLKKTGDKRGSVKHDDHLQWSTRGEYYQPNVEDAGPLDFFWCGVELCLFLLKNIKTMLLRLGPYITLIVLFAGFVAWNGGVVLGDKSNHVPTIHLPQMLYIWPFIAFFSIPLIYPYALSDLLFQQLSGVTEMRQRHWRNKSIWYLAAIVAGLLIVHFNTIIHPFTLADNRHYVFYIFRYSIRRHPLVKYALVPIYLLCGTAVIRCLTRSHSLASRTRVEEPKPVASKSLSIRGLQNTQSRSVGPNPDISFVLIWLTATSLSLVTAPLVELRYFIIPWVIWRLNVPGVPLFASEESDEQIQRATKVENHPPTPELKEYWAYSRHDHRLWLETLWFLLISLITGYVFLFKGFEWSQEPGRVQRFMW